MGEAGDVTTLLSAASAGDDDAKEALITVVYAELRRRADALMRAERSNHTLQATALVHEAYLKLVHQDRVDWRGRGHFFAVSSQIMRRILVDAARARKSDKRGGRLSRVDLEEGTLSVERDEDVLALEDALQTLAELDPEQADLVVMRFYGGLTMHELAASLGRSKRSIELEWTAIKAWLRRALTEAQ